MLEDFLGEAKWPMVALVAAVVFALAYMYSSDTSRQGDVQKMIVQQCATTPNIQQCADQLAKAVEKVN